MLFLVGEKYIWQLETEKNGPFSVQIDCRKAPDYKCFRTCFLLKKMQKVVKEGKFSCLEGWHTHRIYAEAALLVCNLQLSRQLFCLHSSSRYIRTCLGCNRNQRGHQSHSSMEITHFLCRSVSHCVTLISDIPKTVVFEKKQVEKMHTKIAWLACLNSGGIA